MSTAIENLLTRAALSKFEPDFWIELEKNYFESLKQRKSLLDEHGSSILNYSPSPVSELACRELMEMVLQNLCIRYPRQFSLEESNTVFVNRLLDTRTDLTARHPLHVLFDNVPEDFAIMMRNEEDGVYHLRAGYICSSIGWTFGTHFGRPLRAIHTEVNDYDKMAKSMDKYAKSLFTFSFHSSHSGSKSKQVVQVFCQTPHQHPHPTRRLVHRRLETPLRNPRRIRAERRDAILRLQQTNLNRSMLPPGGLADAPPPPTIRSNRV